MIRILVCVFLILCDCALISYQKPIETSGANTRQFIPFNLFGFPPLPPQSMNLPPRPLPFDFFGHFIPNIPFNQGHIELWDNPVETFPFFPWFPFPPQFAPYGLPPVLSSPPAKPVESKPPVQQQPQQVPPQQIQTQQVQPQQFLPPMFYMPSIPILESSINNGTHFIYSNNTGTFVSPLSAYDFLNQLPV